MFLKMNKSDRDTYRSILNDVAPGDRGRHIGLFGRLTSNERLGGAPQGGKRTQEETGDAEQLHLGTRKASKIPRSV